MYLVYLVNERLGVIPGKAPGHLGIFVVRDQGYALVQSMRVIEQALPRWNWFAM